MTMRKGRNGQQQRLTAADACCEASVEAELEIPIPSMEIKWSLFSLINSGGSSELLWDHTVKKVLFRSP